MQKIKVMMASRPKIMSAVIRNIIERQPDMVLIGYFQTLYQGTVSRRHYWDHQEVDAQITGASQFRNIMEIF